MKDSEFIELLNLYLDHEIGAADVARLEAAVLGHPERRRVYQQYCRMQKACTLLAKDFNVPETAAPEDGRKIVAFDPAGRSAWGPRILAVGGLVAAACFALVFVNRSSRPAPAGGAEPAVAKMPGGGPSLAAPVEAPVLVGQAPNAANYAAMPRTVTVPAARRADLQPVLAIRALSLGSDLLAGNPLVSSPLPAQLDWIGGLKIAPMQRVQAEDLRLEARPIDAAKSPIFHSRARPDHQGVVEMTAFQFQK